MDHLHEMVLHDKILMCQAVLALGLVAGVVGRVATHFWQRQSVPLSRRR
jgi:hypothetical protein